MITFKLFLESYKKKYESAPQEVKDVADHMAMLKKQPTDALKRMTNQSSRVHSARSKSEYISLLMQNKFGLKKLEAHDKHFFGESLEINEAKYPEHSPMAQKSVNDVKSALGAGKFNLMSNHKWFREYGSYEKAYKHGVTRAGFHEVEVYPYMKEVHTTSDGAVRPTTMLTFHFSPTKVTQVHKFTRGLEKDASWKHTKSWKKDEG
jgi:hypothetical protein